MIALIIPFMALAALGFVVSLAVHLMALTGHVPPGGNAVFVMHGGIFIIWLPAMMVAIRLNQGQRQVGWRGRNSWKSMLAGAPPWMTYAVYGLFAYAFVNFFLAMGNVPEHPTHAAPDPQTLRLFSGHWMLFYSFGFAILYSAFRQPWRLTPAKCPAGHPVAHSDHFCPVCGTPLQRPTADA